MEKQYDVIDNVRFNRVSHKAGGTLNAEPEAVQDLVDQGLLIESTQTKTTAAATTEIPAPVGSVVVAPGTNADTSASTIVDGAPAAVEKPAAPAAKKPAAKKAPAKKAAAKKTAAKAK